MKWGLLAGITWALDAVVLSVALMSTCFFTSAQAVILASFTSTFLHDASAALILLGYNGIRRKLKSTWTLIKSKTGRLIVLAAIFGGPLGMSTYVFAINNIGAVYTTAISALFPAFGALLAHFILKEDMKGYQYLAFAACLTAIIALSFNPDATVPGDWILGMVGALVTVMAWGTEAVIVSYALRFGEADTDCCVQIRETTSALVQAVIILPFLPLAMYGFDISAGWTCVANAFMSDAMPWIFFAGFFCTASYLCYYKAIEKIGATRGMALDITYSGWAIPISLIFLGTVPSLLGVICAFVIIVGAIVVASDVKELFHRKEPSKEAN